MDTLFLAKVSSAFIVGSLVIVGITCLAERTSPRWAGVISAMPTTLVCSMVFVAILHGVHATAVAMSITPTMILAVIIFVWGFTQLSHRGLLWGLLGGFVPWGVMAFITLQLPATIWLHLTVFTIGYLSIATAIGKLPNVTAPRFKAGWQELAFRAAVAGTAIASTVVAAEVGGPLWGGIFACFPAAIFSTLYLITRIHGHQFARGIAKNMPHGSAGCAVFAVVFYLIVSHDSTWAGFAWGIAAGYVGAIAASTFLSTVFKRLHLQLYPARSPEEA